MPQLLLALFAMIKKLYLTMKGRTDGNRATYSAGGVVAANRSVEMAPTVTSGHNINDIDIAAIDSRFESIEKLIMENNKSNNSRLDSMEKLIREMKISINSRLDHLEIVDHLNRRKLKLGSKEGQ